MPPKTAAATASPFAAISVREQEHVLTLLRTWDSPPTFNFAAAAEKLGLNTAKAVRDTWFQIRRKLDIPIPSKSVANSATTDEVDAGDGPRTPGPTKKRKTPTKATGSKTVSQGSGDGDADEHDDDLESGPSKKKTKATPKKAGTKPRKSAQQSKAAVEAPTDGDDEDLMSTPSGGNKVKGEEEAEEDASGDF